MERIDFAEITPECEAELEGDEVNPWGVVDLGLRFQPKDRHVALQAEDGTLVAWAGTVVAEAQVGEQRFPVLGIGGVIVRAPFRAGTAGPQT